MNQRFLQLLVLGLAASLVSSHARIITVTTTNNIAPPAGETSLLQALSALEDGDEIRFAIPGPGPHYLETPPAGYPLITRSNITLNGYSQPGSSPNSNPILAPNNAALRIVLDSRNGHSRLLDRVDGPNDDNGYGGFAGCILGVWGASGFRLQGVSLLATPVTGADGELALYGVSFAKGASGQVSGCWIGVDPDGASLAGPAAGITGFRYEVRAADDTLLQRIYVNDVVVGVAANAANAPAEFNVIAGVPQSPIVLEGSGTRIAGNFIEVLPNGLTDYDPAFDPTVFPNTFRGAIAIGPAGNNTQIGTDGDGVNDADERNVIGGTVPEAMGGYRHTVEFYGTTPGTNIVIAGNFVGVGIDGRTWFTNGVPMLGAAGSAAVYRVGSNLDGVSDDVEGNLVYNNLPADVFPPSEFAAIADQLNFLDDLATGGTVSLRGNSLVNNFPFPSSPFREGGSFLASYYAKALRDPQQGVRPTLSTNTSFRRLMGTVPLANPNKWPTTMVDLYVVDPVGQTNGMQAGIPGLPYGFVQGRRFLASFAENGPADLNPKLGEFEFDISRLQWDGPGFTITANYSKGAAAESAAVVLTSPFSDPVAPRGSPAPVLTVTWQGQSLTIAWAPAIPGFTLQSTESLSDPQWTDLGTDNPTTVTATGEARFYQLIQ